MDMNLFVAVEEAIPEQKLYLGVQAGVGETQNYQCSSGTLQHQGESVCAGCGADEVLASEHITLIPRLP